MRKACLEDMSVCKTLPREMDLYFSLKDDTDEYIKYDNIYDWMKIDGRGLVNCEQGRCDINITTSIDDTFIYSYSPLKFIKNSKRGMFNEFKLNRRTGELLITGLDYCKNIIDENRNPVRCPGFVANYFGFQDDYWVVDYQFFSCQKAQKQLF